MPFSFHELDLEGLVLVEPRVFDDERGAFLETFKESDFHAAGIETRFVQENFSRSHRGVVRGLHFQLSPFAQAKLVWVTRGSVWDVAVDLRADSPTYRRWRGMTLSDGDHRALYIPAGFAHGFQALEEDTRLAYRCSAEYNKAAERGIRYDDGELAIEWPLGEVLVSEKDAALPSLSTYLSGAQ